jgi:hypothetical protein
MLLDRLMCSERPRTVPAARLARMLTGTRIYREEIGTQWLFRPELPISEDTKTIYVEGYWQAHQFPYSMEQSLRREFAFRDAPSLKDIAILNQIRSCESPISLHIRRGDYTLEAEGNHALPISYYKNAIRRVRERFANPTFFVFSDDIEFARENLPKEEDMIFVDHNSDMSAHEDLRLMSSCRHHIIANSTFSWWGAWLNANLDKLVCVPDRWLDPKVPCQDLIPADWLRVPVGLR